MNDTDIKKAIIAVKDMSTWLTGDANEKHYKTLVDLAQLYLTTAGKMLEEKTPQVIFNPNLSPQEHSICTQRDNDYCLGYNQARQKCILTAIKALPSEDELYKIIDDEWKQLKITVPHWAIQPYSILLKKLTHAFYAQFRNNEINNIKIFSCQLGMNHCVSGDVECHQQSVEDGYCKYYAPQECQKEVEE